MQVACGKISLTEVATSYLNRKQDKISMLSISHWKILMHIEFYYQLNTCYQLEKAQLQLKTDLFLIYIRIINLK